MKLYSIAVDGPSGAGKSSLARKVAKAFGFIYVDTGAIYRTVGLYCYRNNVNRKDENAVKAIFPELNIEMRYNEAGEQRMFLNGEDVSVAIRHPDISLAASDVSALPAVRAFLMDMQRKMAETSCVIMDGRDIGTVVLPNADLKIFLTASSEARAQRRLLELREKGLVADFNSVHQAIIFRDRQDTERAAAPLRQADDAVLVDTSEIGFEESFELLCSIVSEKLGIERV